MKNILGILLFSLLSATTGSAQTFEEYLKSQKQQFSSYVSEQKNEMQRLQNKYNDYVRKQNEEFAKYLERQWSSYNTFKAHKPSDSPKPVQPISYEPPRDTLPPVKILANQPPLMVLPKAEDERPRLAPVSNRILKGVNIAIDFYGQNLVIRTDTSMMDLRQYSSGQADATRFWNKMSAANYGDILLQISTIKDQLNLNDWGIYQLIRQYSEKLSGNDGKKKILYAWFLMTVEGYQNRLAFSASSDRFYLLLPSKNNVFGCQYLKFNGQEYYFISNAGEEIGSVETYDQDNNLTRKKINLAVTKPLNFTERFMTRKLTFSPDFPALEVNVPQNEMDFYATYPQTDFSVYMGAPVYPGIRDSLMTYFGQYAKGRNQVELASVLLEFTQKAFAYKSDISQFGVEKWFFPDEIFHYPFCDCEDRAALLSWLVYNLDKLDVIGVLFPGHMSTAVLFPVDVTGDYVVHNNKHYTICDGTFIGAPIGRCMPQFVGKQADIIVMPGTNAEDLLAEKIWENISQHGGYPGDGIGHVSDLNGNTILTGWFDQDFSLGKQTIHSTGGRDLFVASYNADGNLNWVKTMAGNGSEYVTGIVRDSTGNLVISGNFCRDLKVEDKSIFTEKPEQSLFLLSMRADGQVNWLTPVFFDDLKTRENIYYQVQLDMNGELLSTEYLPQQNMSWGNLLMIDAKNHLLATGGFSTIPGMIVHRSVTNEGENYDLSALLKDQNDKLILSGYNKGVAGLFAVFMMLSNFESKLTGVVLQQTLDKYNPAFKVKSPLLYKSLAVVEFLKNSNGIITIRTLDNKYLEFDMLKVKNEANMKLLTTPDGDARIDFLSGAKVGKAFVWFPLNSITVIKKSGDLIFNYAKDHSISNLNINKDILY